MIALVAYAVGCAAFLAVLYLIGIVLVAALDRAWGAT